MEIYLLITSIVMLLGVIFILIYLEKFTRTSLVRFNKEREEALLLVQTLATGFASTQEQINVLLVTLETNSTKRAEEAVGAQSKNLLEMKTQLHEISTRLNTLNATAKAGADELGKEFKKALQESTKQIQALKESLEESIKF